MSSTSNPDFHHTPVKSEIPGDHTGAHHSETPSTTESTSNTTPAVASTPSSTSTESESTPATTTPSAAAASSPSQSTAPSAEEAHRTPSHTSDAPKAEGSTVSEGQGDAKTEYPEQMHAGKAGLGPHYNDGSGIADRIAAKSEIIKGKLTHNPALVEQGHLRESGALAARVREAEQADDSDSPFAKPDDGHTDKKPENPKAEKVEESGHEARTAAATSGTKSDA